MSESDVTSRRVEQKIDQQLTVYSRLKLLFVILAAAAFLTSSVILMLVLGEVQNNTKATNTSVSQLKDCIDPKGTCYKSGDRRSGAAVKTINESQKRIVTVASYCAKQPSNITLSQIESCVNKELAK